MEETGAWRPGPVGPRPGRCLRRAQGKPGPTHAGTPEPGGTEALAQATGSTRRDARPNAMCAAKATAGARTGEGIRGDRAGGAREPPGQQEQEGRVHEMKEEARRGELLLPPRVAPRAAHASQDRGWEWLMWVAVNAQPITPGASSAALPTSAWGSSQLRKRGPTTLRSKTRRVAAICNARATASAAFQKVRPRPEAGLGGPRKPRLG